MAPHNLGPSHAAADFGYPEVGPEHHPEHCVLEESSSGRSCRTRRASSSRGGGGGIDIIRFLKGKPIACSICSFAKKK